MGDVRRKLVKKRLQVKKKANESKKSSSRELVLEKIREKVSENIERKREEIDIQLETQRKGILERKRKREEETSISIETILDSPTQVDVFGKDSILLNALDSLLYFTDIRQNSSLKENSAF